MLVARHNPWLSDNTNITTVAQTNAQVAARKRTVPGVKVNVTYSLATYGGPAQYLSDLTNPADPKSPLEGAGDGAEGRVVQGKNADGSAYAGSLADVNSATPTGLVAGARQSMSKNLQACRPGAIEFLRFTYSPPHAFQPGASPYVR